MSPPSSPRSSSPLLPFAEKESFPTRHAPSRPSADNLIQYIRRRLIAILLSITFLALLLVTLFTPVRRHIHEPLERVNELFRISRPVPEGVWDGWDKLDNIYAFGDSYTSMGFEVDGTQPSLSNPFGNPEPKGFAGSGQPKVGPTGPLWIHFLTMDYNTTTIRTYDFARGGSTVDRDILAPVWPTASTFKDEVDQQFLPNYASKHETRSWSSSTTLFTAWFGINDILVSYHEQERTPNAQLIEGYSAALLSLYHSAARNFLIFTLPPFDLTLPAGKPGLLELSADISDYNRRLRSMRDQLLAKYPQMNIFLFDVHALFLAVMDNPGLFSQTEKLRETRRPCRAYDLGIGFDGPVDFARFDSRCEFPADQYLWNDDVHPTSAVHNATAALVVEDCMGPGGRKRYCS